jgi:hypothetical protein
MRHTYTLAALKTDKTQKHWTRSNAETRPIKIRHLWNSATSVIHFTSARGGSGREIRDGQRGRTEPVCVCVCVCVFNRHDCHISYIFLWAACVNTTPCPVPEQAAMFYLQFCSIINLHRSYDLYNWTRHVYCALAVGVHWEETQRF